MRLCCSRNLPLLLTVIILFFECQFRIFGFGKKNDIHFMSSMCIKIDPESGITGYNVGIGSTSGKTDVTVMSFPKTANAAVLKLPVKMSMLNKSYFVTVVATNGVGKSTSASSDGFILTDEKQKRECIMIF